MDTATLLTQFLLYWLCLCAGCLLVARTKVRQALAAIVPCLFLGILGAEFTVLEPWQRLFLGTVGLLFTIKASILLLRSYEDLRSFSKVGLLIYMSVWPGMDPQPFAQRVSCLEDGRRFVRGYSCFWLGLLCLLSSAILLPSPTVSNWICLAGLLLAIHFGYADMLSCAMRLAGWDVQPLFDAPLMSRSLREFWGRRWNLAFVEMDKILFLPLLRRLFKPAAAILSVFVISGLLHEIAISYASGELWGLPLLYFLIQGVGIMLEKRFLSGRLVSPVVTRIFTWIWLLAPLPLLFNTPFQSAFMAPLSLAVQLLVSKISLYGLLSLALWLAAAGHFSTLLAGLQVPFRLHWKEELSRLSNINSKTMLYCAANVGLMIISFGSLTVAVHDQLLSGEKAAVSLAVVIALFWVVRLLVDRFYFRDADWPKGPEFVIGHALLNTLFLFLSGIYVRVVLLNWPLLLSNSLAPMMVSLPPDALLSQALWVTSMANICALIASVPLLLPWKEELSRLSNFNRKIMINYAAYVAMIMMAFAWLTFSLHDQLLRGDTTAVCLAVLMAVFWLLRLLAECFYFRPAVWSKASAIGFGLRIALLLWLISVYSSIVYLYWFVPHLLSR